MLSSSYVLPLLRQTPALIHGPFATIAAIWSRHSADTGVVSTVPVNERQALNAMLSTDWLDVSPSFTVAHWAATFGYVDVLHYCNAVDVSSLFKKDQMGNQPLHWAAKGGSVASLQLITDIARRRAQQNLRAVDILHSVGERGANVAFLATSFDHAPVLEYLSHERVLRELSQQDHHVRRFPKSHHRTYLVHAAASCGALRCIELLNAKDIDLMVRDSRGRTIVHYAAENGTLNVLEYLHRSAPRSHVLHELDDNGGGGLHYAARGSKPNAVPFFHEIVGTPIRSVDSFGRSAAMWCVLGGKSGRHIATLRYMNEKGLPLDAVDGRETLMEACQRTHGMLCQLYRFLGSQQRRE